MELSEHKKYSLILHQISRAERDFSNPASYPRRCMVLKVDRLGGGTEAAGCSLG